MPVLPKHTVTFILPLGSRAGAGAEQVSDPPPLYPGAAPPSGVGGRWGGHAAVPRVAPGQGPARLHHHHPRGWVGRGAAVPPDGRPRAGSKRTRGRGGWVGRAPAEAPRAKVKLRAPPGPARPCLWRWPWRPWQGRPQAPGWSGRRRRRRPGAGPELGGNFCAGSQLLRRARRTGLPAARGPAWAPALKGAAAQPGHRALRPRVAPGSGPTHPGVTEPWVA